MILKRHHYILHDDMIIVRLMGGFGNQMFQYCFGLSLKNNGRKVFFDTSYFNIERKWNRTLDLPQAFNLELNEIGIRDKYNQIQSSTKLKIRLLSIIKKILGIYNFYIEDLSNLNIYNEDHRFSSKYYLSKTKGYFNGYWQSLDYVKLVENDLLKTFSFKPTISNEYFNFKALIDKSEKNCSLHWRRGDYLEIKSAKVLSQNYFIAALNYIVTNREIENVFVFSEDCEYVKSHLEPFFPKLVFHYAYDIFHRQGYYHEVRLMSECKNNIISNSTFSWWGAYLNKHQDKIVITPVWDNQYYKYLEILPNDWIRIEID